MLAARAIFGEEAFRKRYKLGERRLPVNKALFEAWSVNLDKLSDAQLAALKLKSELLKQRFTEVMNQAEFDKAVSQSTGDVGKVKLRFSSIEQIIADVLQLDPQA
jgi:hypothetical protein